MNNVPASKVSFGFGEKSNEISQRQSTTGAICGWDLCVKKLKRNMFKIEKKNYTVCKYPCAARLNAATWISFQFKALCFMSSDTLSLSL